MTGLADGSIFIYSQTASAADILRYGHHDVTVDLGGGPVSGCRVTDRPLDTNEGAVGRELLQARATLATIEPYEVIGEGKPYREWLVPADVLNALMWTYLDDEHEGALGYACTICAGARALPSDYIGYDACHGCVIEASETWVVYEAHS